MQTQPKVSLQNLVTTVNRTKRVRPIPPQQPGASPAATENKPLQSPVAKCAQERVRVKNVPTVNTRLTYEQRRRLSELARRKEAELPYLDIEEAVFTIYSTAEIKAIAVVEVTNTEQFGPGSVNDPQMGPTDSNSLCATCSKDYVECPGHPGYIQFPEPFIHPLFLREVIKVLNIVCNDCGGLLLTRNEMKERGLLHHTGPNRLTALETATTGLSCRHEKGEGERACLQNPTYKPSKTKDTNQITYEYMVEGEKVENIRTPQEILDIFNNIKDEDVELMGFTNGAHPRRMVMEVLMVIPPPDRPADQVDGKYMADPLTTMYIDIIRQVKNLKDHLEGKTAEKVTRRKGERKRTAKVTTQELRNQLYIRLKHFINNTDGWYNGGGQPFISLTELLQSKEGLIRANIMAKRVDFSSRTVLSPDPTLAFGQISVPSHFISILTPKVKVNKYNRAEMQNLLQQGRITYITFNEKPGDETMTEFQLAGTRILVTEKYRTSYTLRDGDVVERWMQNGDIVIFNRQPTLHKYSFMGFRAVIRDQKTFGLHLSYTTPINADFDGDEGNAHILQVLDARAEAEQLMSVRNCLINAQSNKPTMGIVFDGPVGAMLLTQPETTVRAEDFYDALSYLTQREQLESLEERMNKYNIPYTTPVQVGTRRYRIIEGEKVEVEAEETISSAEQLIEEPIYETRFSGRALFSALLPEDFYYEGAKGVIIQEGVLTNGVITKTHIGPERNSIIHVMAMNYPVGRVADFITDATFVLNRYLQEYGFSIGLSSCLVDDPEIEKIVKEKIEEARILVRSMGAIPDDPNEADKYEEQILAYVGAPADAIGRELQTKLSKKYNALNIAALSGAKGKVSNLVQIAAFLGQQHISGGRIKAQMTYETRCLPWYRSGEESLESRGFCTSSFLKGLPPSQAYFHAMATREGLMGTAVSTGESGFMHRKAVKTLQDIKTAYDGSVRNIDNTVFEYIYGDDGFAPNKLQPVETKKGKFLSFFDAKNVTEQINRRYGF